MNAASRAVLRRSIARTCWLPLAGVAAAPRAAALSLPRFPATAVSAQTISTTPVLAAASSLPEPLTYKKIRFNSATVDAEADMVEDTAEFALRLWRTIEETRAKQMGALWLTIPVKLSHYIPIADHYNFKLHHVNTSTSLGADPDTVSMVLWLRDDLPNKVPRFATHHVGVAGCVTNDKREVLVVRERARDTVWKFPGGLADLGEDLGEAAAREVYEETGVECDFQSVLTMRHQHQMQFGNSDLYFICRMLPRTLDISACSHEIAEAVWMPLDQFKRDTQHSMLNVVAEMLDSPEKTELTESEHQSVVPGRPPFRLYHHVPQ